MNYVRRPCPGLRASNHPNIPKYLRDSGPPGGGAPSLQNITKELFPHVAGGWSDLTLAEQLLVVGAERAKWKWRSELDLGAVYATDCLGSVEVPDTTEATNTPPCEHCQGVLRLKLFKNALNRKPPKHPENRKFTTKRTRRGLSGAGEKHLTYTPELHELVQDYQKVLHFKSTHRCVNSSYA